MARTAHPLFRACLARDAARRKDADRAQGFQLHALRKDGQPSGMHDARMGFASEADALAHVARVRSLNPGRVLRYALNGTEV